MIRGGGRTENRFEPGKGRAVSPGHCEFAGVRPCRFVEVEYRAHETASVQFVRGARSADPGVTRETGIPFQLHPLQVEIGC